MRKKLAWNKTGSLSSGSDTSVLRRIRKWVRPLTKMPAWMAVGWVLYECKPRTLRTVVAAMELCTPTNCWWGDYRTAQALLPVCRDRLSICTMDVSAYNGQIPRNLGTMTHANQAHSADHSVTALDRYLIMEQRKQDALELALKRLVRIAEWHLSDCENYPEVRKAREVLDRFR